MFNSKFKRNLHNCVIDYKDINNYIPFRNQLLKKQEYNEVQENINKHNTLLFMPNTVIDLNIQDVKFEKAKYKIAVFGVFKDGRKATVILDNILPYFEVWIPEQVDEKQFVSELVDELKQDDRYKFTKYEVLEGREFIGFNKYGRYIRFYFDKLKIRRNAILFIKKKFSLNKNSDGSYSYKIPKIYEKYDIDLLKTTTDDGSSYYNVVCRDYLISFTSWVELNNWKIDKISRFKEKVFRLDINDYKKTNIDITKDKSLSKDKTMSMTWDIETFSEIDTGNVPMPNINTDRMFMIGMTFQWYNDENQILRICLVDVPTSPNSKFLTIVCGNEKNIIKAFADIFDRLKPDIITGFNDGDYDWKWLVERAANYPGILPYLSKKMQITVPWRNEETKDILNYSYKKERVKISAETVMFSNTLHLAGYIPIDVRIVFRQLYPTSEKSSLNWFLTENKLSSKFDMPYQEMFRIYREICKLKDEDKKDEDKEKEYLNLKKQMSKVGEYCVIDAQRCHELLKIRNVIMDRRQIAEIPYVSLFDAFYRAGGMKVKNLIIGIGQKYGIRFSIFKKDINSGGKYPGAYVVTPDKGLETSKYTFNELVEKSKIEITLPPEKQSIKYTCWKNEGKNIPKYQELVKKFGAVIKEKNEEKTNEKKEEITEYYEKKYKEKLPNHVIDFFLRMTGRPVTGLDFSSLYPSLIRAYNLSPEFYIDNLEDAIKYKKMGFDIHSIKFNYGGEVIKGWTIRHNNEIDDKKWSNDPVILKDPTKWEFKFGIVPYILNNLFNERSLLKKELHIWESEKEKLEALDESEFKKQKEYYNDVVFKFNYIDSKQKALKVFMNTFYGELGNKLSPFFVLALAGGITDSGKKNIKLVKAYCEMLGCFIKYGDTDSVYIKIAETAFKEVDMLYYSGQITKEEYWNKLVEITFNEIKIINEKTNKMLIEDNGTKFLKMAYEEVLYPVAFLAKKKYYGIPHISVPNFKPKNLFIRGLEVKKRGVSQFLRDQCLNIMWESVSMNNTNSLKELVENKIDSIFIDKDFKFDDFVMSDVYKPLKQNVKVQTFVKRMFEQIGDKCIKPYERFNYVIVKKYPYKYDEKGRKKIIQVGEKMEFIEVAQKNNLKIDLDYYMKGSVNGQLARLITYHPDFHVDPPGDTEDDLKIADDKIYKNACKYIENYCDKYYEKYEDVGVNKKNIYKKSNKILTDMISQKYNDRIKIDIINTKWEEEKDLFEWIHKYCYKLVEKNYKYAGDVFIHNKLKNLSGIDKQNEVIKLAKLYYKGRKNLKDIINNDYDKKVNELNIEIKENYDLYLKLLNFRKKYISIINKHVENDKNVMTMDELENEILIMIKNDFNETINTYNNIFNKMKVVIQQKYEIDSIIESIDKIYNKMFENNQTNIDLDLDKIKKDLNLII